MVSPGRHEIGSNNNMFNHMTEEILTHFRITVKGKRNVWLYFISYF